MMVICAVAMALYGTVGIFGVLAALVLQRYDFSDDAPNTHGEAVGNSYFVARNMNRANRKRRSMIVFHALACGAALIGYIVLFWKVGTFERETDLVTTNWSAFVMFGVAMACMVGFFSYFLASQNLLAVLVPAVFWGGSIALLGIATLPHHGYKRWLLAGLATVAQALGFLAFYGGSVHMQPVGATKNASMRVKRPFYTVEAYLPLMFVVFGFVLYDVAFFVGYFNAPSSMVEIGRWESTLVVFFANFAVFVCAGVLSLALVDVDYFTRMMLGDEIPYANAVEIAQHTGLLRAELPSGNSF